MKNKSLKNSLILTYSLLLMSSVAAKNKYDTSVQKMICGKATYTLQSICMKSEDDMSLNECKQQKLKIENNKNIRNILLPELNKSDIKTIKGSGGVIEDLYVVKWGCGNTAKENVAVFYYSIGGGSAPYSEAWAQYDENGEIIQHGKLGMDGKAMLKLYDKMEKVKSINPE